MIKLFPSLQNYFIYSCGSRLSFTNAFPAIYEDVAGITFIVLVSYVVYLSVKRRWIMTIQYLVSDSHDNDTRRKDTRKLQWKKFRQEHSMNN